MYIFWHWTSFWIEKKSNSDKAFYGTQKRSSSIIIKKNISRKFKLDQRVCDGFLTMNRWAIRLECIWEPCECFILKISNMEASRISAKSNETTKTSPESATNTLEFIYMCACSRIGYTKTIRKELWPFSARSTRERDTKRMRVDALAFELTQALRL